MSVTVTTTQQLEQVRRNIIICYLCGEPLPDNRRTDNIQAEHVIPRVVLRLNPTPSATPLILDVHADCDVKKSKKDEDFGILNKVLHKGGEFRNLQEQNIVRKQFNIDEDNPLRDDQGFYIIQINKNCTEAAFEWIRGIHTALYGAFLPPDTIHRVYIPGREAFHNECTPDIDALLKSEVNSKNIKIATVLTLMGMKLKENVDYISFWCGQCHYACVWIRHESSWRCHWILSIPGDIAHSFASGGLPLPWSGSYDLTDAPANCSYCTKEERNEVLYDMLRKIQSQSIWIISLSPDITLSDWISQYWQGPV